LVVQYRERILQLTPLASVLGDGSSDSSAIGDPTQVIVFAEGDQMAGLIVDQIIDIHDETIRIGARSKQPRLSGSAVLGGKVTDFVDLPAVLQATDSSWIPDAGKISSTSGSVLVADASVFSRGLIRNYLELAGYSVVEAVSVADALDKLDHNPIAAVIAALAPPHSQQLVQEMRRRPGQAGTPVVNVSDRTRETDHRELFQASVDRFDRDALLTSLQHLAEAVQSSAAEVVAVGR
jgi:two-component system, chemotaxis family, sensor kinase CheA